MKKSIVRKGSSHSESFVDSESGEILSTNNKTHKYLANTKEEFFLMYSSILSIFHNMEQSEIRVYGYLLKYADATEFAIDKALRVKMGSVIELHERTIYNTLITLVKKNLLFKKEGLYMVNPRYAFKGSSLTRNNKLLSAIVELGYKEN